MAEGEMVESNTHMTMNLQSFFHAAGINEGGSHSVIIYDVENGGYVLVQ